MRAARVIPATLALLLVASLSAFLAAAQHYGPPPAGDYTPRRIDDWRLSGPAADDRRVAMLLRAEWRLSPADIASRASGTPPLDTVANSIRECRFLNDAPSGSTAKFNCVLDGGTVLKVKYGRNPEIQGEVAATHLLRALGFPADEVTIVPRLRCYGCPRDPFVTSVAGAWTYTRQLLGPAGFDNGYSDFEWASIERRFQAPTIETETARGWAWWEVQDANDHRSDLDALRLLAVFLAHWDNKPENQRLVCLDGPPPSPVSAPDCARPLAMIQDLGATFGPTKVNIGTWSMLPVWADAATCRVSMHALPWHGGTFPDVQITEAGRRQLADALTGITDDELRELFRGARFPEFQSATSDERDLEQWTSAFKDRVRQILDAGPCPNLSVRAPRADRSAGSAASQSSRR